MFILFIIYYHINFDLVLICYTDDGSLELGSKTFEFDMDLSYTIVMSKLWNSNIGKVDNAIMAIIFVTFVLCFIGKLCFLQGEHMFWSELQNFNSPKTNY